MKKANQYDPIATFYERISNRILGKGYIISKSHFLGEISSGDKVLILGGGTGENLHRIINLVGPSGKVYFMEASLEMIKLAKQNVPPSLRQRLKVLHSEDFNLIPNLKFKVVVTQYFLDVLTDRQLELLFGQIQQRVNLSTKWIFVDFFPVRNKRLFLFIMIHAFRILVRHPRKKLPDYHYFFNKYGWKCVKSRSFQQGFIQAKLFQL